MLLSKLAVNRPITIVIIFGLFLALGIYASLDLPIDLYPDINPPVLFVFTDYSGTAPEEIEKLITRPLESALSNVANIDKITSTSSEGSSQIILEFTWGTNMDEAVNDTRDKLERIKQYLPDDAETPMIFKFDPAMMPIMYITLTGDRSPEELRQLAEDIVQPRLEQVEGVAMVSIYGGRERVIRVEIMQNRLQAYNLTLTQVSNILGSQNIQISAGSIPEGNKNYLIRTIGEYQNIEEIKNTVIATKTDELDQYNMPYSTKVIRLRDIANVYDGIKKEEEATYYGGKSAIFLSIQKQSGKNSVKTADNVFYRIYKQRKIKANYKPKPGSLLSELPPDIKAEIFYDTTKLIRRSLNDVGGTAFSGAILAIIILFFFLRSAKAVSIIGISIPISVIITLLLMYFFGFTLNVMTLAGLVLGIGMLVDNSIVILDNIYRYREKGTKITSAAILGSQEMMIAITASTLTTICVFLPIAIFKSQLGMYGELFSGLSFTVVFSLSSSLIVAIFLTPVLASKYLPISSQLERNLTGFQKIFDDKMVEYLTKLDDVYKKVLTYVLHHRKYAIMIIAGVFIISIVVLSVFVGFELIPKSDDDAVQLKLELPPGTKLDVTKSIAKQFEQIIIKEIKGYKSVLVSVGERSFHGFLGGTQSHKGSIFIILNDDSKKRPQTSRQIQDILRKHFNDFPSVIFTFDSGRGFGGQSSPIDILIKSNDLDKSRVIAQKLLALLKEKVPEAKEPIIDLKDGLPQIEILIDRQKAYSLGLNMNAIGQEIRANIDGITVPTKYKEKGNEYDILVISDPTDRDTLLDLDKIFILNNMGQRIPLASITKPSSESEGPVSINRENQKRTIHITAQLTKKVKIDGKNKTVRLNEVEAKIRRLIKSEIPQDEDIMIEFSGEYADLIEYGIKLVLILLVSILLVFGIMAAQFESFLDPFIILFTIPLSLIGVTWIYLFTFEQFNLLTVVGIIVLSGVVVNNGIVLVDYTNLLIKRGMPIMDACIAAGRHRLRPILMTTLTTVLGLLPSAFTKIEGADLSRSIAKTMLGGLTISTIFTLFLIPVIYSIFNQFSEKFKTKRFLKREQQLAIRKEKLSKMK